MYSDVCSSTLGATRWRCRSSHVESTHCATGKTSRCWCCMAALIWAPSKAVTAAPPKPAAPPCNWQSYSCARREPPAPAPATLSCWWRPPGAIQPQASTAFLRCVTLITRCPQHVGRQVLGTAPARLSSCSACSCCCCAPFSGRPQQPQHRGGHSGRSGRAGGCAAGGAAPSLPRSSVDHWRRASTRSRACSTASCCCWYASIASIACSSGVGTW